MNKSFTPPLRVSPHNIEAEQALLGAILVNNDDAKIEALVERGYLMPNERDDVSAIEQAVSVFIWASLEKESVR